MRPELHLRLSLACIAAFLGAGLWLETMYGLRIEGWIDDAVKREFLRLGHAHGALLSLLNVAIAWALERLGTPAAWAGRVRVASLGGALAVGVGFFGGGLWHGPTDPGPLVLLVPAGAMMLLASVLAVAVLRGSD